MPARRLLTLLLLTSMVIGIARADTAGQRKSAALRISLAIVDTCNIQFVPEAPPRGIAARVDCSTSTPYRLVLTPLPGPIAPPASPGGTASAPSATLLHAAAAAAPGATVATITF